MEMNAAFSSDTVDGATRSIPWMHPFREHPVACRSVQLELPNLNDSPEILDVPMSRANSSETTENEHGNPHRDASRRLDLIHRISEKLHRDCHLFAHQNEHHSRNNTENEEEDTEYGMNMPIPTVMTPRSSPPLQSVMHKKRKSSKTPEITAIEEQHEPTEYDTALSSDELRFEELHFDKLLLMF